MKRIQILACLLFITIQLQSEIMVIEESPEYLLIEFRMQSFQLQEMSDYIYITGQGLSYRDDTGAPMLPIATFYIGIPENGALEHRVVDQSKSEHNLSRPILPMPEIVDSEQVSKYLYRIDHTKYHARSSPLIEQSEATYFRFNKVIPLTINPVEYQYAQSKVSVSERLLIEIRISGDTAQRKLPVDDLDLGSTILNYNSAKLWQMRSNIDLNQAPFHKSDFWYNFEVSRNGMHELTYQHLSALPLDDINPRKIRIFTTGGALLPNTVNDTGHPFREIPLLVTGEDNGRFDPDDSIIFYAHNRDGFSQNEILFETIDHYYNPYSVRTVYWLTFGGSFPEPPLRITMQNYPAPAVVTFDSTPAFYHYQNENVKKNPTGFTWFSSRFSHNVTTNHNYNVSISNVDQTRPQTMITTVEAAKSANQPTIGFSAAVNGITIIDRKNWAHDSYRTFAGSGNFLQSGNNNVVLTIYRDMSSALYFDYFQFNYFRRLVKENTQLLFHEEETTQSPVKYNLTGQLQGLLAFQIRSFYEVSQLPITQHDAGSTYDFYVTSSGVGSNSISVVKPGEYYSVSNFQEINPEDLTKQAYAIDAIIITTAEFRSYADQLAQIYLDEDDIIAKVVEQQDIFNQFNSGMPDPNAIRLFIRYAYYNYPITSDRTLKYVTLVGSGTIDWRNYSGQAAEKNRIMIFQRGIVTSEDFYVDLSGNQKPDLAIGRIPIENTRHADIVIGKLYEYRYNKKPGFWRNTLLFLADDEFISNGVNETIHTTDTQDISQIISRGVITDKVLGIEYSFDPFGNKPQARNDVVSALNEGRLIWIYIGHGNYDRMGHENYFRTADIPLLNNRDRLPLFIGASCSVALYQFPGFNSVSEHLLWHSKGGSIASLAATALTSSGPNKIMVEQFLIKTVNQYQRPGIALMETKNSYSSLQSLYYTYLGDPVLAVNPPLRTENLTIKDNQDSLFAYQKIDITGKFSSSAEGVSGINAYSSEYDLIHTTPNGSIINYTKWGNIYYRGQSSVESGEYEGAFLITGDIRSGKRGRILAYIYDHDSSQDYLDFYYPKLLTNIPYAHAVADTIPPEITVWLDTPNFRNGDIVSANPTLYARIHDESGINILGKFGHRIILTLDFHSSPIDFSSGFIYDIGSYQTGMLTWPMTNLSQGEHRMQLIAFDNFNNPTVETFYFTVRETDKIVIENLLPYPNPISSTGYFTFLLTEAAEITITIYTFTGKRIRTLKSQGIQGYNQILWDGRDQEGSRLANNTYLYKVRARQLHTNSVTEKLGKVVILR